MSVVVACVFLLSVASGSALTFAVFGFAALIDSRAVQAFRNAVFFEASAAPQGTVFVLAFVQMYPPWADVLFQTTAKILRILYLYRSLRISPLTCIFPLQKSKVFLCSFGERAFQRESHFRFCPIRRMVRKHWCRKTRVTAADEIPSPPPLPGLRISQLIERFFSYGNILRFPQLLHH